MTGKFELTGGARIGTWDASYPLANLSVDKTVLKINASVIGNLVFQAKDIKSIEVYKPKIGLGLSKGLQINHTVENYPENVIFWTRIDPNIALLEIKKTGFLEKNTAQPDTISTILKLQEQGVFPIKTSAMVAFALGWNLLFILAFIPFFMTEGARKFPFSYLSIALGIMLCTLILVLFSADFRSLILKEGRTLNDIKAVFYLITFIVSIQFIVFSVMSART